MNYKNTFIFFISYDCTFTVKIGLWDTAGKLNFYCYQIYDIDYISF